MISSGVNYSSFGVPFHAFKKSNIISNCFPSNKVNIFDTNYDYLSTRGGLLSETFENYYGHISGYSCVKYNDNQNRLFKNEFGTTVYSECNYDVDITMIEEHSHEPFCLNSDIKDVDLQHGRFNSIFNSIIEIRQYFYNQHTSKEVVIVTSHGMIKCFWRGCVMGYVLPKPFEQINVREHLICEYAEHSIKIRDGDGGCAAYVVNIQKNKENRRNVTYDVLGFVRLDKNVCQNRILLVPAFHVTDHLTSLMPFGWSMGICQCIFQRVPHSCLLQYCNHQHNNVENDNLKCVLLLFDI